MCTSGQREPENQTLSEESRTSESGEIQAQERRKVALKPSVVACRPETAALGAAALTFKKTLTPVAAVFGTLRLIGLEREIAPQRCTERDLVVAMIVARIFAPGSKLATARGLGEEAHLSAVVETRLVEGRRGQALCGHGLVVRAPRRY